MMEDSPDPLDAIEWNDNNTTSKDWTVEGKWKPPQESIEKFKGKNESIEEDVDVQDGVIEITNKSIEKDVDVLINGNETFQTVVAGTTKPMELPHNIRNFRLRNNKSGNESHNLSFADNRRLLVQDWKYGSLQLELWKEAGEKSTCILQF